MPNNHQEVTPKCHAYNPISIAVLFAMAIAIVVGLIGIVIRDTSPWILILPAIVAFWSIVTIRQ